MSASTSTQHGELTPHDGKAYDVKVHCTASRPQANTLRLSYELSGSGLQAVLGLGAGSAVGDRADGLWQRTCLEAFVRQSAGADSEPYFELNAEPPQPFACWQVYRFDSYWSPSTPAEVKDASLTCISARWRGDEVSSRAWALELDVWLPEEAAKWESWDVFPSAVVQGVDRTEGNYYEAFWALAHAEGKPDFHKMVAPSALKLDFLLSQVTLVFLNGREEAITLEIEDKVLDLQKRAAEMLGQPAHQAVLCCGDRRLDPDEAAAPLSGATLTVTVRADIMGADISDDMILGAFRALDADSSGSIDVREWKIAIQKLGFEIGKSDLCHLISDSDDDGSGTVELCEFTKMMQCDTLGPYGSVDWLQLRRAILEDVDRMHPKLKSADAA